MRGVALLIRLMKRLPAPLMDGFDVRRFEAVGQIYSVDMPIGRYLIIAGYALQVDDRASTTTSKPRGVDARRPS